MKLEAMSCPNCGAPLADENRKNYGYLCGYCNSQIWVKDAPIITAAAAAGEQTDPERVSANISYCCVEGELADNKDLNTILCETREILDRTPDSQSLAARLVSILQGKKEAATKTSMEADFRKVQKKLDGALAPTEELLLYKTAAFFQMNKLRTGMYITDRRVGYLAGSSNYSVEYGDLESLVIDIGLGATTYWYPNGKEDIFLSALAVTEKEFAVFIAYLILRAKEEHNADYTLMLKMKEEDDSD